MKGLIIRPHWAEKILSGEKTLELRGSNTRIRGTIGIIQSGTGKVFGTVELVDSIPLNEVAFNQMKPQHQVFCSRQEIPYPKLYGWKLENPIRYKNPIPYTHKQGCVTWVNLEE